MVYRFFSNFKKIAYGNQQVVDIVSRPDILENVSRNPYAYYPYTVKNAERPDFIARAYYGDPYFSWLVYLSNKTIDPYYGWMIDDPSFQSFIVEKYGSTEIAQRKIVGFRTNWDEDPSTLTISGWNALVEADKKYWTPVLAADLSIQSYTRREIDWTSETNFYQTLTINTEATFAIGDLVSTTLSGETTAQGEICIVNTTSIVLKHIQGNASRFIKYAVATPGALVANETASVANDTVSMSANVYSSNATYTLVTGGGEYPTGTVTITGGTSEAVVTTTSAAPTVSVLSADFTGNSDVFSDSVIAGYSIPFGELAYWEPYYAYEYEAERNAKNRQIRVLDTRYAVQAYTDLQRLMSE
jgi:hypothetical protein